MARLSRACAFLLLACACAAQALASDLTSRHAELLQLAQTDAPSAFRAWTALHSKEYTNDPEEFNHRRGVFAANAAMIAAHNARRAASNALPGTGVELGLNEYADLTWEEFSQPRLGFEGEAHAAQRAAKAAQGAQANGRWRYADVDPPASVDWREKGVVTAVKNQGACGSCWAFSATGAIEGVNALYTGQLATLSEQELVDCDRTTGNAGCSGGLMDYAFKWVEANGGIDTEDDYTYWSGWGFGMICNKRKEHDRHAVTIDGHEDVPVHDEAALRKAASQHPVAVAICASPSMQFYRGGVIDDCCDQLNHGVLLVGYGTDDRTNTPYWLVKNSWGGGWGEEGYFKLKAGANAGGKGGMCGILEAASYPLKSHANPKVPTMCDPFGWQECASGSSCSCSWWFPIFHFFCLRHDCCPIANGVSCDDAAHCCPGDMPHCDTLKGRCFSDDGAKSVPWSGKTPATFTSAAPEYVKAMAAAGEAEGAAMREVGVAVSAEQLRRGSKMAQAARGKQQRQQVVQE